MVILNKVGGIDISQGIVTKQIGLFKKTCCSLQRNLDAYVLMNSRNMKLILYAEYLEMKCMNS
jgi:hypothetical protein